MNPYKYLQGLVPAVLSFISIALGGWWALLAPVVIFGFFPLMELIVPASEDNLDEELEKDIRAQRVFDYVVYATVPVQFALLGFFLYRVGFTSVGGWEIAAMAISMGMSCGALGINAAHELGHRRRPIEKKMAKALLLTSLYMHFIIEHNRGHHARVATEEDPASARYGENLFAFFFRSITGSYRSAWEIENSRLRKQGRSIWTWDNEMIRFTVIEVAFVAAIAAVFGVIPAVAFIGAAFCGALLLETVNYIEHYGLQRQKQENGRYERVLPIHSWNSNHPLGRLLLFELSRHSDHHAHARRKYQILRHFDHSPQLPTGYPGMMALAWFPPLWFAVMHRHIEKEEQRVKAMGERTATPDSDLQLVA
jgi:alkane 1-monooxygenase